MRNTKGQRYGLGCAANPVGLRNEARGKAYGLPVRCAIAIAAAAAAMGCVSPTVPPLDLVVALRVRSLWTGALPPFEVPLDAVNRRAPVEAIASTPLAPATSFVWTFEDTPAATFTTAAPTITYTFRSEGPKRVSVTARDAEGRQASAAVSVIVREW